LAIGYYFGKVAVRCNLSPIQSAELRNQIIGLEAKRSEVADPAEGALRAMRNVLSAFLHWLEHEKRVGTA
jgi:hypothetical protein